MLIKKKKKKKTAPFDHLTKLVYLTIQLYTYILNYRAFVRNVSRY